MTASYKTENRTHGLKVTQIKSGIGTKPKHRGTLRALGLGRIGNSTMLPDCHAHRKRKRLNSRH